MTIEWKHIMDCQPDHGKDIIQIDPPYDGHYCMGMRKYDQSCTFEEVINYCKNSGWPEPNFWWIYSNEFPFPDKKL